jgi:hypothetical protein
VRGVVFRWLDLLENKFNRRIDKLQNLHLCLDVQRFRNVLTRVFLAIHNPVRIYRCVSATRGRIKGERIERMLAEMKAAITERQCAVVRCRFADGVLKTTALQVFVETLVSIHAASFLTSFHVRMGCGIAEYPAAIAMLSGSSMSPLMARQRYARARVVMISPLQTCRP